MNSAADRLTDDFPHGTVDGFEQGCRGGGACPAGTEHGLSCRRARILAAGDYRYQRMVRAGSTPAEIADALGLNPDITEGPRTPKPKTRHEPRITTAPTPRPTRAPRPTPPPPTPKPQPAATPEPRRKWQVRRAWVAFSPTGTMQGPFDDQLAAVNFVGDQLRAAAPRALPQQQATKRRPWTDDDALQLRRLHAEGLSDGAIARRMGRSQPVVSSKRRDAGLTANGTQSGQKAAR